MRPFIIIIAALMALASARPEPPTGYTYNVPSHGLEYPSAGGSLGASNVGLLLSTSGHGASYNLGSSGHGVSLASAGGAGLISSGIGNGLSSGGIDTGAVLLAQQLPSSVSSSSFVHSSGSPVVQKHIYVHVPPPEPQEYKPPKVYPVAQPQKHYKIIFIKAPTPPTPTVPSIPVQPQDEEKTLVYVLVKKPEEAPEIHIPQPHPTQPSKPEVYFIRYKTQKEADVGGALLSGGISGASGIAGASLISGGALDVGSHGSAISSVSSSSISNSLSSSYGTPSSSYGPPKH